MLQCNIHAFKIKTAGGDDKRNYAIWLCRICIAPLPRTGVPRAIAREISEKQRLIQNRDCATFRNRKSRKTVMRFEVLSSSGYTK